MTPETKDTYRNLVCRIKSDPYWFRCVRECDAAGCDRGERACVEFVDGPGTQYLASEPCNTCNGTSLVFRDDDRGREVIRCAVANMHGAARWSQIVPVDKWQEYNWPGITRAMEAWNNRHGKDWQPAFEAHVREYEADPEDLEANDGAALKRLLREEGIVIHLRLDPNAAHVCLSYGRKPRNWDWYSSDTEAAALFAAAQSAFGETE